VVLALVVAGGVLQVLSRFTVFDRVNGQTAEGAGIPTSAWVLGVGLPLVMALLLFVVREGTGWTGPLAAGLVLGAVVCQLDQALGSLAFFLDPDDSQGPGPAWWLAVAGTAALISSVVVSARALLIAPAVRRDWRAVVGVLVVLAALVAWLQAFSGFWVWFAGVESGLLLAALCLPLSGLSLSGAQRLAGLAAVTVFGAWLVAFALHAFAVETYLYDQRANGIALLCTLVSVAACCLAQIRPPARRPPAAEALPRL
jgi:hypothetical protein